MTTEVDKTDQPRILLVDDNEDVRTTLAEMLDLKGFRVTAATSVNEALHLIATEPFDVLLSDLHMPGAGDGFTVVSAMRHMNPDAVTLLFTGFPALEQAMNAILLQADEVLVKPMPIADLVTTIRERLGKRGGRKAEHIERVASILEREVPAIVNEWLSRVERDSSLTIIPLSKEQRTGHLPKLIQELVQRLRTPRVMGTAGVSQSAADHGKVRKAQGYSIPMIIEESRILQVSLFQTLQTNLTSVDFSSLLADVMTIADEVDSQLKQTIIHFTEAPAAEIAA